MKKKLKTKEFKGYTEEQLSYFQYLNDQDDGVIDDVQDVDYVDYLLGCLLYTSPSPRDGLLSRMPSSA